MNINETTTTDALTDEQVEALFNKLIAFGQLREAMQVLKAHRAAK